MRYVFDTGPLIDIFNHYYPARFPSLWEKFDSLVSEKKLISVREVYNEILGRDNILAKWAKEQKDILFLSPSVEEFQFVAEIFKIQHFQSMIRKKERLQGKPVADPFVIARAKVYNCNVVTTERYKENASQIPNVCKHFSIPCINLEDFMQQEKWIF